MTLLYNIVQYILAIFAFYYYYYFIIIILCVCVCVFMYFFIIQIQNNQKSQDNDSNHKKLLVNKKKITIKQQNYNVLSWSVGCAQLFWGRP